MKSVRLGDVVEAIRGVTFPASELLNSPAPGLIACLTTSAVHEPMRWATARFIPRDFLGSTSQILRPGDILVSTANSKPNVGTSARVDVVPFEATFGAFVTVARPGPEIDSEYLSFWFRSPAFLTVANALSSQTTNIANLRVSDLLTSSIPLPSLDDQRRIAAELARQFRSVEVAQAAVDERGKIRERLLERCLAEQIVTRAERGWTEVRLKDVVHIQLGKMLSPASKIGSRPISYLRNANVQWDRFALSDVYQMDFTEAEERKFRLEPGDVLVCEGGQPGRAAIWAGEIERCCYQKALHRIRPIADAVDPRFLMYRLWLGALRGEFTDNHSATTIAHLPAVRLASLKVRLPNVNEQRRIAAILREELASIEVLGSAIRAEQEAIEALPAALLRRAFQDVAA
jgi:Restriction endonuclease S subunits